MARPAGLLELPDLALLHIFGCLRAQERHRLLPFVCHRFWDLCYSPQLLPTAFNLDLSLGRQLTRVRSFAEWLVRRGAGRVQRLRLTLSLNTRTEAEGEGEEDGLGDVPTSEEDDQLEMLTETLAAVAYCAAGGSLQDLELCMECAPAFRLGAATVAALAGLRRLALVKKNADPVSEEGHFAVVGPLHTMTALRELKLGGEPLRLRPGLRLPPGLTKLDLGVNFEHPRIVGMSAQLFELCRLRHLRISNWNVPRQELSVLAPLSTLERLELDWCSLPDRETLAGLSSLAALKLVRSPVRSTAEDDSDLVEALQELQHHLTELWVDDTMSMPLDAGGSVPPELATCTQLRRLAWLSHPPREPGPEEVAGRVLPPGPWLRGLRRLALPCDVALASVSALSEGAPHLEWLAIFGSREEPSQWLPLLQFAAQHPPLRRLAVSMRQPPPEVAAAAAAAQQQKPALEVVWAPSRDWAVKAVLGSDAELARMRKVLLQWRAPA